MVMEKCSQSWELVNNGKEKHSTGDMICCGKIPPRNIGDNKCVRKPRVDFNLLLFSLNSLLFKKVASSHSFTIVLTSKL